MVLLFSLTALPLEVGCGRSRFGLRFSVVDLVGLLLVGGTGGLVGFLLFLVSLETGFRVGGGRLGGTSSSADVSDCPGKWPPAISWGRMR